MPAPANERELVSIETLGFFDNHSGLERRLVNLLGHDNCVNTVETVRECEVGGNLSLRIDPSAALLGVNDGDRAGLHWQVNAKACGLECFARTSFKSCESNILDRVSARKEVLHHSKGSRCDIEGESESTSGDVRGNNITLLVKNLVGAHVLAFPSGRVLDNLSERLGSGEGCKGGVGVVADGLKHHEVALSFKQLGAGIKFCNRHSYTCLLKSFLVFHLKLREVTEYPEDWFGVVGVIKRCASYSK